MKTICRRSACSARLLGICWEIRRGSSRPPPRCPYLSLQPALVSSPPHLSISSPPLSPFSPPLSLHPAAAAALLPSPPLPCDGAGRCLLSAALGAAARGNIGTADDARSWHAGSGPRRCGGCSTARGATCADVARSRLRRHRGTAAREQQHAALPDPDAQWQQAASRWRPAEQGRTQVRGRAARWRAAALVRAAVVPTIFFIFFPICMSGSRRDPPMKIFLGTGHPLTSPYKCTFKDG